MGWREQLTGRRAAAIGALLVAFIVVIALIIRAGSKYEVHALFTDASQLVKGDLVEVGGQPIGTIQKIGLTDHNQADVLLNITDDDYKPFRAGTLVVVRPVGQSGVANRYLEITPGPENAPEIPDGGTLPANQTRPQVDLDALLTSLDPPVRKALKKLFHRGATIFDGKTKSVNRMLGYLNPALGQTRAVMDELARDTAAVERLVTTGATLASAVASRRPDLQEGITNAAATMRAVAAESDALGSVIERSPAVLRQGRGTLRNLTVALAQVNPALREAQPSAAPLARLMRQLPPFTRAATPVLADVRTVLPPLNKALLGIPALARVAVPALRSTTRAIGDGLPIFAGLRPYGPDLASGLLQGVAGKTSSAYDANGHFVRVSPHIPGNASGIRTGLTARCPGAADEPGVDASNPWIPDPALCDPEDNHR